MKPSFTLINRLQKFLDSFEVSWVVAGGWAIDIHLNRISRKHCDLDISVPFSERQKCIHFFLEKGWRIEGKLAGGFKTLRSLADDQDDIRYFWSFPHSADFVSEYVDIHGNRRIAYNRQEQRELDYIEVFFDMIEDKQFVFRKAPEVQRHETKAILQREGVYYLAPEVVLLIKASRPSEKNNLDFDTVVGSLGLESRQWLREAITLVHGCVHPWLEQLEVHMKPMPPGTEGRIEDEKICRPCGGGFQSL